MNSEKLTILIEQVRRIGDEVLLQWRNIQGIQFKPDETVVTSSDHFVEKKLMAFLPSIINQPVFSEESIHGGLEDDCWLVDPIDGTGSFVAGIPTWAISIASIRSGHPDFGLIYFPAFKKLIHSNMPDNVFSAHSWRLPFSKEDFICTPSNVHQRYDITFPGKVRSLGSCCMQILCAVTGKAVFSLLGYVKFWDFAAGFSMIEKAGCTLFHLNGEPLNLADFIRDPTHKKSPLLVAPTGFADRAKAFIVVHPDT